MSQLDWEERMGVRFPEIDKEHKHFLEMLRKVNALECGDRAGLANLLNELLDYAAYHFSNEERVLREKNYPGQKHQAEAHQRFIRRLLLYKNDFDKGKELDPEEIFNWMAGWLVGHIMRIDKKYEASLHRE